MILWSPFIALEYFDIFFEHVYNDVGFALNPIDSHSASLSSQRKQTPPSSPNNRLIAST